MTPSSPPPIDNSFYRDRFNYSAFGLTFCSSFEIPELSVSTKDDFDVKIVQGPLQSESFGGFDKTFHFDIGQGYFYLRIAEVGQYLISNQNKITVDPAPNADPGNIRLYLLGTIMGVLLSMRGYLPLHGSGIATTSNCALFLGESGIGKSTIAAAMSRFGYSIITDDICAIAIKKEGQLFVNPAYPQIKLFADSANHLKIHPQSLKKISQDRNKFKVQIPNNFQRTPLPLSEIFILNRNKDNTIKIEPITGIQKYTELSNNIYRGGLLNKLGFTGQQFKQTTLLCSNISAVSRVFRPETSFCVDRLAYALHQHLKKP